MRTMERSHAAAKDCPLGANAKPVTSEEQVIEIMIAYSSYPGFCRKTQL
jgi:hypothetical protein